MLNFNNPAGEIFLANLNSIQDRYNTTQRRLSSGLKIAVASDQPDQISGLLQLKASLARNTQVQTNLTQVQNAAATADQAVGTALQFLDQAASLGAQGNTSTQSASGRQVLAGQVQTILQQVVSLSQTNVGGRYLFSGDADRAPLYQYDAASPTGVDRQFIPTNTTLVEDANSNRFSASLTAQDLFDHRNPDDTTAPDNVFAALSALQTGLTNNDQTAIGTALSSLQTASTYLNTQQGFYGSTENRLTSALNTAQQLNLNLTQQISGIQDADFSQEAINLSSGQTQLSAALTAESKVPHTSLFDFLG